jgi:ABC-2 type transport system permease protein
VITWTVAFGGLGVVFGYLTISITDILAGDPMVQQVLASGAADGETLVSAFLVTILSLAGIIAAVAGVQIIAKLRTEEMADRVEPIIATALGRSRYLGGSVVIALAATAVLMVLVGLVIAALASSVDIGLTFGDALLQAVATIPAVWTLAAFAVAVIGARPAVAPAAWLGVLVAFGLTILGPTFDLPDPVLAISPVWHVPAVSAAEPQWSGLVLIGAVAAAFLALGFAGFRRRDLAR